MKTIEKILPAGFRFRELWLPEAQNNSATLPSSVAGGQKLTLTGARNGTTSDGVHFTGAATSNIDLGAIHDAATKLWVSLRFKCDVAQGGSSPIGYLFQKDLDANNILRLYLYQGALYLVCNDGSGVVSLSTGSSYAAGTWYHVIASLSSANGMRLRVNSGTAAVNASTMAVPNGGTVYLSKDAGGNPGLIGTIADVVIGTDDLSLAEEADLYNGVPPSDAVGLYPLDEGVGTTAVDRGSGANNGTLGALATWEFGKCKQACIGNDGRNDSFGTAASSTKVSAPLTMLWAVKHKCTYSGLSGHNNGPYCNSDASNYVRMRAMTTTPGFDLSVNGSGTIGTTTATGALTIDSYGIYLAVVDTALASLYKNGSLVGSATVGYMNGPLGNIELTSEIVQVNAPSKTLAFGLIEGALSAAQVKQFSRTLDQMLNLGIGV